MPAPQLWHTPSSTPLHPLAQTCPVWQAVQALHAVNPLPVWYLPVSQVVQPCAFVSDWYWPGVHSLQTLASFPVWYVPTGQLLHLSSLSTSAYSPG